MSDIIKGILFWDTVGFTSYDQVSHDNMIVMTSVQTVFQ